MEYCKTGLAPVPITGSNSLSCSLFVLFHQPGASHHPNTGYLSNATELFTELTLSPTLLEWTLFLQHWGDAIPPSHDSLMHGVDTFCKSPDYCTGSTLSRSPMILNGFTLSLKAVVVVMHTQI